MKTIDTYIREAFRLRDDTKIKDMQEIINSIIDDSKHQLFKDVSLSHDTLNTKGIYWTFKYSLNNVFDIDPEYLQNCLNDNDLFDYECKCIYIPNTHDGGKLYIQKIKNNMLIKYDEPQDESDTIDFSPYEIYYFKTDKYFMLRINTTDSHLTGDVVIPLD